MGYYIRFIHDKKKDPKWKIQFVTYRKGEIGNSQAKKPKREWDIPKERWRPLGFLVGMSFEEARVRAKQLNQIALIKRQEERMRKLELEELVTERKYAAFLPEEFVEEFELRFLRQRDSLTLNGSRKFTRAHLLWRAAQKLVIHLKLEPSEWFDRHYEIYDYFYEQKLSISYINRILAIANLWGFFICKKFGKPFLPIPRPRGYERQRLVDGYYQNQKTKRRASEPLRPQALAEAKKNFKSAQFNWLFVSVWFGLRPQEIDNLKNRELWKIETLSSGREILWVYQTKIVALPPEDRWKAIPIIYEEQRFALRMIDHGILQRPLVKTLKRYFGSHISLYGGRKGFTDLMLEKGHSLEAISQWMGHATIGRTWRSYKERRGIKFSLP